MALQPIRLVDDDETETSDKSIPSIYIKDVCVRGYSIVSGERGCGFDTWTLYIYYHNCVTPIIKYRRYTEFERLRRRLQQELADKTIPRLPPKDLLSAGRLWKRPQWYEERRRGLQWFISNILLNPRLQNSTAVLKFLQAD